MIDSGDASNDKAQQSSASIGGPTRPLSFGERAVGLSFNPSNNPAVDLCKRMYAQCIDHLNDLRQGSKDPDVIRAASIAITETQTAQMWAVKAITWQG